jgi:hypothetical protein
MLDVAAMSTIRDLLNRPHESVNPRALTRAIVEHAEWYVPIASVEGRREFGRLILPEDGRLGAPPTQLWMFSDHEAVERAPQQLGFGSISGIDLCAGLKPAWEIMCLNPGSPEYMSLQLPELVRHEFARYARAIPLERVLTLTGGHAIPALLTHPLFYFVQSDDVGPVTLPTEDDRVANGLLVFTASDGVDSLLARIPQHEHAKLTIHWLAGRELFRQLAGRPIDGVLLNPFGPRGGAVVWGEEFVELKELAGQ